MLFKTIALSVFLFLAAATGLYVYPARPALVWLLLGVCWLCYRLSLRAEALFGKRAPKRRP